MFPVMVNYLSPVLILAGASEGIITGSFIVFVLMFLSSLFFGRAYCGWVCPASGMQEATERFRTKKAKTGRGNIFRWIMWITWLGFMIFLFIKAGGVKSADFLYSTPQVVSIMDPIIVVVYLAVVLLVFVMTMIWGTAGVLQIPVLDGSVYDGGRPDKAMDQTARNVSRIPKGKLHTVRQVHEGLPYGHRCRRHGAKKRHV